jgi:hypothetical protein
VGSFLIVSAVVVLGSGRVVRHLIYAHINMGLM